MSTDKFLFDTERLYGIAAEQQLKLGLTYFNENRLIALRREGDRLLGEVEDVDNEIYYLVLSVTDDRQVQVDCDCRFAGGVCEHAVAVLYGYADQFGADEMDLVSAVDEAIQERVKKGRNEVRVKLLSGNLGFGVWQATSLVSSTHWQRSYQVQIRSLDQRMNYCTCPDLASNRLGTCKHIEAVLHHAKSSPQYKSYKDKGCTLSFVYLAWESATRPLIRLQRAMTLAEDLAALLDEYFDEQAVFKGRMPEDFFHFSQQVYGREDFLLGDDAVQFAQQCAEDAAQVLRGRQISQSILQSNGVLPGIKARLFPYQSEGVAFLAARGRALLADDMGLGKTLQAITAACWLADNAGVGRVLIICPASLKHQWAREIAKFTGRTTQIIEGSAENRGVQYRADALFVIINYELVLRDLSVISEQMRPDLLILDEAQRIKNWRTKLASTVKLITSRYVFVLSGTPLENRLEDLYSLLQLVDARVLGPLWRCLLDFHITDERGKVIGYRNLSELRRRIAPVMLRRNRSLVSDQLPERTEVTLDIAMTDKQIELHDHALKAAGSLATIAKQRPLTPSEQNRLMSALQQARMACNAAGLVDKESIGSPKLDELAKLLEELCLQSDRKVVVFSQWALMTEMVETLVKSMGLGCVRLYGGVPTAKRGEMMERFQQDAAVQVFISTDAGGVGLNLQSATVLINLDMPWNPAVLDQRIARIHRLGQKQNVQIFLLMAADSYEQHVARLVQGKRDLFDNVVDPNAAEDVVGISKKMLETLIDDLASDQSPQAVQAGTGEPEQSELFMPEPTEGFPDEIGVSVSVLEQVRDEPADDFSKRLIEKIQGAFGRRLERILGRSGGLVVVVDKYLEADEQFAEELSAGDVPVAVIDGRTWRSLQRLGKASPIAETSTLFAAAEDNVAIAENPLLIAAQQKLRSAEVLQQQQCIAGVMDLLASAVLLRVTALSGETQVPALTSIALWLYSEILPRQILTPEQVALVMQVVSLSQSQEVPEAIIEQALGDVREWFARLG